MGHHHHHDTLHVTGQRPFTNGQNFYGRTIADKILEIRYISLDICKYKLKS
jgi:hypothetical protein